MAYGAIIGQSGVTGEYLPLTGGTINGNVTVNGTLTVPSSQYIETSNVGASNGSLTIKSANLYYIEMDGIVKTNHGINANNTSIINVPSPVDDTAAANKAYVDSKNILVNDKPITETSTYQYWLSTSPSNKTTITIPKGGMYSFRMSSGMGDARVNIDKINGENPLFTVIVRGEIDYHTSTTAWADSVSLSLVGSQYVIIDS